MNTAVGKIQISDVVGVNVNEVMIDNTSEWLVQLNSDAMLPDHNHSYCCYPDPNISLF